MLARELCIHIVYSPQCNTHLTCLC